MMETAGNIERRATKAAYGRTKEEPVILLEGPRSTGKSTLIRALAAEFKTKALDFDNTAHIGLFPVFRLGKKHCQKVGERPDGLLLLVIFGICRDNNTDAGRFQGDGLNAC
jgi:Cdc6-like AAA superfamily ATPase